MNYSYLIYFSDAKENGKIWHLSIKIRYTGRF